MQEKTEATPQDNMATNQEAEQALRANRKPAAAPARGSTLTRSGSVRDLISRFSGSPLETPAETPPETPLANGSPPVPSTVAGATAQDSVPSISVSPPGGTEPVTIGNDPGTSGERSGRGSPDSGTASETSLDSKQTEDSQVTPTPSLAPHSNSNSSAKYQLFLSSEQGTTLPGSGAPVLENGSRLPRWESSRLGSSQYQGSLESLSSRDWDWTSERQGGVDSPPRVFNSPYATAASMEFNPAYRMSDYKGRLSPATSEMNLYSYNSRSTSPVMSQALPSTRTRFSAYDALSRRRVDNSTVVSTQVGGLRSAVGAAPNRRDYIEELTKQLDVCQKRNQFLEAESVEMEKERNQIRFEVRGLLVNNEDLLRSNTQLTQEVKRMREVIMEMERERDILAERHLQMEVEMKEARDMMVEANTQEYAFNFLQQSLKNKIQDAEENLERQTQHAQTLAEQLWQAERRVEQLELDNTSKDKKNTDLSSTVLRLETELGAALQSGHQAAAELSLQQKLREDSQLHMEQLEEQVLEKTREVQSLQEVVGRLQAQASGKLVDKERCLEEEIQLRERITLQCKQAERTLEDLQVELQSTAQARDELAKQVKQTQEKAIDLEGDVEELHESEQRWASKHKRALEQTEQLQLKLIQQRDQTEQLECEKAILERQLRDMRLELEDLHSSRVPEDVVSKTESRVKELENTLRAEERNRAVLNSTVSKLERKLVELSAQLEEENRISTEQKDLMTQRMRSLKRQLNEAEEEASRREGQLRYAQRELAEERETSGRLQRSLLDQHLQTKRKEFFMKKSLDLSEDEEELHQSITTV